MYSLLAEFFSHIGDFFHTCSKNLKIGYFHELCQCPKDVNFEFEYLRGRAYLQLFNVMGQLVHEIDLEAEGPYLHTLDVTGFGSGLYSYRIDHNGFELLTGKFIIYTP